MEQPLSPADGQLDQLQPLKPKKFNWLFVVIVTLVALSAAGAIFYNINIGGKTGPETDLFVTHIPTPSASQSSESEVTSNLPEIKEDLGLFRITESDRLNNYVPETKYFDAGALNAGQYKGYRLIVGYTSANDPSGGAALLFATKDDRTYLLDKATELYAVDLTATDSFINTKKVVGEANFSDEFPKTEVLGNFALISQGINLSGKKSSDIELTSQLPGVRLFYSPFASTAFPPYSTSSDDALRSGTMRRFVDADTRILAQNNNGLSVNYFLISQEDLGRVKKSELTGYLNYAEFLAQNEIVSASPVYKSYGELFPGGCGNTSITYILKNITDNELEKIGATKNGADLFIPKDKNSDIYKVGYYVKVTEQMEYFKQMNNVDPPSFEDYVAKNPILIYKDTWNRWLALGETEYNLVGGCGKPVIYLYPTKPTVVTVRFVKPMIFSTVIPNYIDGWKVLAAPDGSLKDLQPQFTACSNINDKIKGSEYAKEACQVNDYPYLYWAGQSFAGTYEIPDKGWVVAKDDVNYFLDNKLTEMGFNDIEKNDMLAYWVSEFAKKNAPYYRLSFLQTDEVNKFIPMIVTPTPNTTFRLFLDWSPLSAKPAKELEPQSLAHLDRNGFTLVEWGGLKK
jgi:hypothetical protein